MIAETATVHTTSTRATLRVRAPELGCCRGSAGWIAPYPTIRRGEGEPPSPAQSSSPALAALQFWAFLSALLTFQSCPTLKVGKIQRGHPESRR